MHVGPQTLCLRMIRVNGTPSNDACPAGHGGFTEIAEEPEKVAI